MILLTDESTLKKQLLLLTFIAKIAESLIKAGKAMTKPSVGRPKRSSSKMFDQHQPKWRELQKLSFLILIQDITRSLGHWVTGLTMMRRKINAGFAKQVTEVRTVKNVKSAVSPF